MRDASGSENDTATFRNGRLRIGRGALHYSGSGWYRRNAFEMRLSSVTAVGVSRWLTPYVLAMIAPVFVLAPALFLWMVTQDEGVFINIILLDFLLLPFALFVAWRMLPPYAIRVVGGGVAIQVPFGRRRLDEAIAFVRRTSAATMQPSEGDVPTHHPKTPKAARE